MIKDYAIVFWSRDSRKARMDIISADSKSAARRNFYEIYRLCKCEILSVTEIPEEVAT